MPYALVLVATESQRHRDTEIFKEARRSVPLNSVSLCASVADLIVEGEGGEGEAFEADAVEDEEGIRVVGFVEVEEIKRKQEVEWLCRFGLVEIHRIFELVRRVG